MGPGPEIPARLRDVLITAIMSMLLVGGTGYLYTNHVQRQADARHDQLVRESERKWCKFVAPLDDAWSSTPPQSALGRTVATALHDIRAEFGC